MGADPNGDIQYPLWDHFLPVPLLGRDDHVPWHDNAYGNLVYDHMAQKSVRRKRKCRKDPEADPEAHHRAYYIRRDRNGNILLYFSCIRYPEYYIQHHIDRNQFSGSGTYDAPFLVLCSMVCGK